MQDIQIYSSHPGFARHFKPSNTSRPRDPFRTPEKKTKPCNYSPMRKSMKYEEPTFT
jgi:hypothetical protein